MRRLSEELGITGIEVTHRGQVEYRADVGGGLTEHEVVEVFTVQADLDLEVTPNPSEVMDVRWLPLPQLRKEIAQTPEKFTPWLRIYMAKHSALIFGNG